MTNHAFFVVYLLYWTLMVDVQLDFLSMVMVSEEHGCNLIDKKIHIITKMGTLRGGAAQIC